MADNLKLVSTNDQTGYSVQYRTDFFTRLALTVCASLIATGVVALWQMNSHVSRLEERMSGWTRSMTEQVTLQTRIIEAVAARQRENETHIYRNNSRIDDILRRIDNLEKLSR